MQVLDFRTFLGLSPFFLFLFISLVLGDGKQPFVDVWWAMGILMMYGVRYYQRGKPDLRPLPRLIGWAWVALILYYIVRTPFSDSVGYSITNTIRLLEAYLLFVLFYTISSEPFGKLRVSSIELFTKGLIVVGAIAILASWVFIAFPTLAGFLPLMNLLYASYGHNHLADLLLPIFPLLIGQLQRKPSKWSWFLFIFYVIGMVLTFARGAWILLVGYFVYVWIKNRNEKSLSFRLPLLVVSLAFILVFSAISLYSTKRDNNKTSLWGIPPSISRLLIKPNLQEDGRLEYWRQAIVAIRERPWFGSGPGTFYLQSKRLQDRPSSWSWFAHSLPLQSIVELGIMGTLLLFVLIGLHIREVAKIIRERAMQVNETRGLVQLLAWGVLLSFLYSFYEFNLDYLVLWLLFWSVCGVLMGYKKRIFS